MCFPYLKMVSCRAAQYTAKIHNGMILTDISFRFIPNKHIYILHREDRICRREHLCTTTVLNSYVFLSYMLPIKNDILGFRHYIILQI